MPKYINTDKLLEDLKSANRAMTSDGWTARGVWALIERQPAADVEPVVHCRDCKYRDQSIPVHNAICTKCYEMDCTQGYGFCSMGERMEKDDE